MDEDLDIRQALRKHVTVHEPAFTLTAEALVAAGRRRGRWRAGMTYGAGSIATVVAVTGALTVLNPGGVSTMDDPCGLPLAAGWRLPPSIQPDGWPTTDPSGWPAAQPSGWPNGQPSAEPPFEPSGWPIPSGSTGPRLSDLGASPWPVLSWTSGPEPSGSAAPSTPLPEVAAANCFLARELRSLLPEARYAPSHDTMFTFEGGLPYGYVAEGIIVGPDGATKIIINIQPQQENPPHEAPGWASRVEDGKLIRTLAGGLIQVEVYTGTTMIYMSASGPMLTVAQVERIASAPELELLD